MCQEGLCLAVCFSLHGEWVVFLCKECSVLVLEFFRKFVRFDSGEAECVHEHGCEGISEGIIGFLNVFGECGCAGNALVVGWVCGVGAAFWVWVWDRR